MLSNISSLILISSIFISLYIINYLYIYYNDDQEESSLMNNFMGTILILFGSLKLINLKKFSIIFKKYNIISQNLVLYSYLYPFIEIILGVLLLLKYNLNYVYKIVLILMIISLISVSLSIYKGDKLRCGCLGSLFHLPLSYVTISENIIMILFILK